MSEALSLAASKNADPSDDESVSGELGLDIDTDVVVVMIGADDDDELVPDLAFGVMMISTLSSSESMSSLAKAGDSARDSILLPPNDKSQLTAPRELKKNPSQACLHLCGTPGYHWGHPTGAEVGNQLKPGAPQASRQEQNEAETSELFSLPVSGFRDAIKSLEVFCGSCLLHSEEEKAGIVTPGITAWVLLGEYSVLSTRFRRAWVCMFRAEYRGEGTARLSGVRLSASEIQTHARLRVLGVSRLLQQVVVVVVVVVVGMMGGGVTGHWVGAHSLGLCMGMYIRVRVFVIEAAFICWTSRIRLRILRHDTSRQQEDVIYAFKNGGTMPSTHQSLMMECQEYGEGMESMDRQYSGSGIGTNRGFRTQPNVGWDGTVLGGKQ
ncbi:unnamed protein product [Notodromas monacha]|uniref:Uncharacterized protein n=1 Tax=Notodromas monacha TaxID=399045 RepID=A0A7R9BMF6_9CRUS|nr:unnamed protein product [Notodromas monacha]CAG0916845.1 unnamed protein product [Notodromas monacha]